MRNKSYACNLWLVCKRIRLSFLCKKNPKGYCLGVAGHCFSKVDCHIGGNLIEQVQTYQTSSDFGHIISDDCNDASDILNRKHSLCGQIYNVICYVSNRNSVVKQSLMNAYCSSLHGCKLWQLIILACKMFVQPWKRGLRRIWGIPKIVIVICCQSLATVYPYLI